MKISVVIPAHNEEKNIERCLTGMTNFLESKSYNYEIVVSEDGSRDRTYELARKFSLKNPKIKVLHSKQRLGKGMGLIRGFKNSSGDVVIFSDADLTTAPKEIDKLLQAIKEGADLAIGSRKLKESVFIRKPLIKRKIASKLFSLLVELLFHLGVKDTQCGFKGFKKEALEIILPSLKSKGFVLDVEIILRFRQNGFKIKEVPIEWKYIPSHFSVIKDGTSMFKGILSLWLHEVRSKLKSNV